MATLNVTGAVRDSTGLTTPYTGTITTTSTTQRGLITNFNPASDNWGNPILIDGKAWFIENANKTWSLTKIDDYTLRMEVRHNDFWSDDGTERSEILTDDVALEGGGMNISYEMTIEPGDSFATQHASWLSLAQTHEGTDIPWTIQANDELFGVVINLYSSPIDAQPNPSPIIRGHTYQIRVESKYSLGNDGYLRMWRDGVQIINYTGRLGSSQNAQYLKLGIYRGEAGAVPQTMAVRFSHIAVDIIPPPPPPPPPPGQYKLGESAILSTSDNGNANMMLAQNAYLPGAGTLQTMSFYVATVGGQMRLGIYKADGPNGGPGTLVAQTAAFTPVVGWNTKPTTTTPVMAVGNYWLCYHPSSNTTAFRKGEDGNKTTSKWLSQTFGVLPATFGTPTGGDTFHWSLYATVNIS